MLLENIHALFLFFTEKKNDLLWWYLIDSDDQIRLTFGLRKINVKYLEWSLEELRNVPENDVASWNQ